MYILLQIAIHSKAVLLIKTETAHPLEPCGIYSYFITWKKRIHKINDYLLSGKSLRDEFNIFY